MSDLNSLLELALNASKKAAKAILEAKNSLQIWKKQDGSPLSSADLASNEILTQILSQSGIEVCSEEKPLSYEKRKDLPRFWLIDPLDGTSGFIKNSKGYCILLALIEEQRPILSLIFDVKADNVYYAHKHSKVYKNDTLLSVSEEKFLENQNKVLFSVHHQDKGTNLFQKAPFEPLFIGSALKFCALLEGEAGFYPRFASLHSWDIAAGDFLLQQNGGFMCDFHQNFLAYNQASFSCKHFIAVSRKNFLKSIDLSAFT